MFFFTLGLKLVGFRGVTGAGGCKIAVRECLRGCLREDAG